MGVFQTIVSHKDSNYYSKYFFALLQLLFVVCVIFIMFFNHILYGSEVENVASKSKG